jgi:hypothetical protein
VSGTATFFLFLSLAPVPPPLELEHKVHPGFDSNTFYLMLCAEKGGGGRRGTGGREEEERERVEAESMGGVDDDEPDVRDGKVAGIRSSRRRLAYKLSPRMEAVPDTSFVPSCCCLRAFKLVVVAFC